MPLDLTGILELRVNSPSVRLYPVAQPTISDDILAATAMTPGANSPSTPSICLLRGPLDNFVRYSRQESSKWLVDLAHDICDPADHRGSLLVWKEPRQQWRPVATSDPLTASIYRYDLPVGITVGLSKISRRVRKSITTATGNASTMADRVKGRDGQCWVTAVDDPLVNSHICPKRMGDHVGRIVFRTFTSLPTPPNLSIYNEIFGLCLSETLDACQWFNKYEKGLRFVSPNNYECHMFAIEPANMEYTILGRIRRPAVYPAIHGPWMARACMVSMGTMQALPSPSSIMFLLPASFVGITFSAYSRDFPMTTTKISRILTFPSYLFVWRGL